MSLDLMGAVWLLCALHHSGQNSRGYRILSLLKRKGFIPGPDLQKARLANARQINYYRALLKYRNKV